MANLSLKVVVGCSVSFLGLLWLYFWRTSPRQKPPSGSTDLKKTVNSTEEKQSSVASKNNLPDVVNQGSESTLEGLEVVKDDIITCSNTSEIHSHAMCRSIEESFCTETPHDDSKHNVGNVEEYMVQEDVMTLSSTAMTESANEMFGSAEFDVNCSGDNNRFSSSGYNSTMNDAFTTTDIGDSIMDKTCDKHKESLSHDMSLSSISTFAEPLLESTKLDMTSNENDCSTRIECVVPLSAEKCYVKNTRQKSTDGHIENNCTTESVQIGHKSGSDWVVNHVSDLKSTDWSSEVENCDGVDKEDGEMNGEDNSNKDHLLASTGQNYLKTEGETTSAHGSDSNTSNCDSASTDSSRASSIVDGPKSNGSKKQSYEVNFPTAFCGRLIGKHGKNIHTLKDRTGANVSLSNHPYTTDFQICLIEGTQRQIDETLRIIGRKFPEVDLTPVAGEVEPSTNGKPMLMTDIMQLNLPEGVSIDVVVSSIVDVGHVFVQQHTHPTFPSLERLNQFMIACYTQDGIVPQLPRPLEVGVVCSAPMLNGWYRAQITAVYDDTDECDIKYVDYGGFSRLPGCTLRQIRSDFMTLPFQAVECYLANVTPLQDEDFFSSDAAATLEELTQGKLLQAQVVGRSEDGTPYIHIYQIGGEKVTFVNRELVNRGVTRWIEILS